MFCLLPDSLHPVCRADCALSRARSGVMSRGWSLPAWGHQQPPVKDGCGCASTTPLCPNRKKQDLGLFEERESKLPVSEAKSKRWVFCFFFFWLEYCKFRAWPKVRSNQAKYQKDEGGLLTGVSPSPVRSPGTPSYTLVQGVQ